MKKLLKKIIVTAEIENQMTQNWIGPEETQIECP